MTGKGLFYLLKREGLKMERSNNLLTLDTGDGFMSLNSSAIRFIFWENKEEGTNEPYVRLILSDGMIIDVDYKKDTNIKFFNKLFPGETWAFWVPGPLNLSNTGDIK
jgi:hypothetical protein